MRQAGEVLGAVSEEPGPAPVRESADRTGRTAEAEFEVWARRAGPRLLALATAMSSNRSDAADAVQDALFAVYLRWSRLAPEGGQDAYAFRTVVNRRISLWRRWGRREQLTGDQPEPVAPAGDGHRGTDVLLARSLLRSLPPRQRAAVALRYGEDLTFAEIADLLAVTESTARSYVHRALLRLRADLAGSETDD